MSHRRSPERETNTWRQPLAALHIAKPRLGGFTYKTSYLGAVRAFGRLLRERGRMGDRNSVGRSGPRHWPSSAGTTETTTATTATAVAAAAAVATAAKRQREGTDRDERKRAERESRRESREREREQKERAEKESRENRYNTPGKS